MGLVNLKCSQCGGTISLDDDREFGFCQYCGNKVFIQQEINNYTVISDNYRQIVGLEEMMEGHYKRGEYGESLECADKLLTADPTNIDAWKMKIGIPMIDVFTILLKFASKFEAEDYSDMNTDAKSFFESIGPAKYVLDKSFSKYCISLGSNKKKVDVINDIFEDFIARRKNLIPEGIALSSIECTEERLTNDNFCRFTVNFNDSVAKISCYESSFNKQTPKVIVEYSREIGDSHVRRYNRDDNYITETGDFYPWGSLKNGERKVGHCCSKGTFNEKGLLSSGTLTTADAVINGTFSHDTLCTIVSDATIKMNGKGNIDTITGPRFQITDSGITASSNIDIRLKNGTIITSEPKGKPNNDGSFSFNASAVIDGITYHGSINSPKTNNFVRKVSFWGREKKIFGLKTVNLEIDSTVMFDCSPIHIISYEKGIGLSVYNDRAD